MQATQETMSSIPRSWRSPGVGNGSQLQYSCLEISMDRKSWGTTIHGVEKRLSFLHCILLPALSKIRCPSVQFSWVTQSCPTLCDPMNHSTPGLPVHHQLLEFTQTHVHRVRDAIQPSHPLSSPFPPAPNPSQHQSLLQQVNSLHEVAKVLEFQL